MSESQGKNLRENGHICDMFAQALQRGEGGMTSALGLLKRILTEKMWKRRVVELLNDQVVEFARFEDFITSDYPHGMGEDLKVVTRLLKSDTDKTLDSFDEVTGNPVGTNQHVDNVNTQGRPMGNARQYALRKLRKDAPEIHQEVIDGDLSCHAGMIKAGFRRKPTSLELLKRAWQTATTEEREMFLDWTKEAT